MSAGHHIRAVRRSARGESETEEAAKPSENALVTFDDPEADLDEGRVRAAGMSEETETWLQDDVPVERARSSRFGWLPAALAICAVLGWTGLYLWAMRIPLSQAPDMAPAVWTGWIIEWSVPVLLVCVIWLLTMRHSRAEAKRFTATAALLSKESRELEGRLLVVNRELSLAREFLGAQSRELESLGRVASERLSERAEELQGLIHTNGAQVEAIGKASETALGNMSALRDELPVLATSARDVSNQIGNAGRTAREQLDGLTSGFERLGEFGKASENQIGALSERIGETLGEFDARMNEIGDLVSARFERLRDETGAYRDSVEETEARVLGALGERSDVLQAETKDIAARLREAEDAALAQFSASKERFAADVTRTVEHLDGLDQRALEASRRRLAELHDEAAQFDEKLLARDAKFFEEVQNRQDAFEAREQEAGEHFAARLKALDTALAERHAAQERELEAMVAQGSALNDQLERLSALIGEVKAQGTSTRSSLGEGLDALDDNLAAKRASLRETQGEIGALTDAGIRLLEIIQAGARHSREDLPQAIAEAASRLANVEERAEAITNAMGTTKEQADGLTAFLTETRDTIGATDRSIESLQDKLAAQCDEALAKLHGLEGGFTRLVEAGETYAGETQGTLRDALDALEQATRTAFVALETGTRERVGALADNLSKQAVRQLERALVADSAGTIEQLQSAASRAAEAGQDTAAHLREELTRVDELTLNLERRIADAREETQEETGSNFARRMTMITDSLNSNAIDISGALSSDVSDTAWDAYLKGDRGIFARRAVRLVDTGEARAIGELFQRDDTFKANVSRYIQDFEGMLRGVLSTREGHALAVTLLGSDIGKLYVALAQAVERFRN
ncbi:MAG: ATPase [Erythrobacter sp.]